MIASLSDAESPPGQLSGCRRRPLTSDGLGVGPSESQDDLQPLIGGQKAGPRMPFLAFPGRIVPANPKRHMLMPGTKVESLPTRQPPLQLHRPRHGSHLHGPTIPPQSLHNPIPTISMPPRPLTHAAIVSPNHQPHNPITNQPNRQPDPPARSGTRMSADASMERRRKRS